MKVNYLILISLLYLQCVAQDSSPKSIPHVGGPCQDCEAIYDYGSTTLMDIDTVPGYKDYKPELILSGTVYQVDEKTPAAGIIIYAYQTNPDGIYASEGNEKDWARRHGVHRAWVKTNESGEYKFYTFLPGSYPNSEEPAHIHLTVKESELNEYYIDNVLFDSDPYLSKSFRSKLADRGGPAIGTPRNINGTLHVKRDIILGKNIPNYPIK